MVVSATARLRFVSIPPKKMRLVANMVKGMAVQRALDVLNFTSRVAAQHVAKTVKSAAANALSLEGTDVLKPEDLLIKRIIVDAAPTAKRIRFQSMGRVFRYRKRFSHLTVVVEGETESAPEKPTRKSQASKEKDKKPTPVAETKEAPKKKRKATSKKTTVAKTDDAGKDSDKGNE